VKLLFERYYPPGVSIMPVPRSDTKGWPVPRSDTKAGVPIRNEMKEGLSSGVKRRSGWDHKTKAFFEERRPF